MSAKRRATGCCAALLAQGGDDRQSRRARTPARVSSRSTTAPARSIPSASWRNGRSPYDLAEPGIAFKRHPCCGSTHPAADAMLHHARGARACAEERRQDRSPGRIRAGSRIPTGPIRKSGLDGKFSIQYVLARALMHGIVSLEHFTDAAVRDRRGARADGARAVPRPIRSASATTDEHFYARLRVTTTSGETFEHFVDRSASAATASIRCRPARSRRNSAIARGSCSTPRARTRSCASAVSWRRIADAGDVVQRHRGGRSEAPCRRTRRRPARACARVMQDTANEAVPAGRSRARAAGRARGRRRQCGALRGDLGARAWRARADARSRAARRARRQFAFHRRRVPLRLSRRRGSHRGAARRSRTRTSPMSISAPTPRSSSSTTCSR